MATVVLERLPISNVSTLKELVGNRFLNKAILVKTSSIKSSLGPFTTSSNVVSRALDWVFLKYH